MVQSASDHAPAPSTNRRAWLVSSLVVVFGLVVLATFEAVRSRPDAKSPSWIWSLEAVEGERPAAIALARDFTLASSDLAANLVLETRADPGAHVYLNGLHVVSTADGRLQRSLVQELLRPGPNRVLVESSSVSGSGGVWLRLCSAESLRPDGSPPESARLLISTDESWSVFRQSSAALLHGWTLLDDPALEGETAHIWGRGDVGHWQESATTIAAASLETTDVASDIASGEVVWAKSSVWSEPTQRTLQIEAELAEIALEEAASAFSRGPKPIEPSRGGVQAFGSTVLDFGEPVVGVLELWIELGPGALPVWFGNRPEDLEGAPHGHIIGLKGHDSWRDFGAREFRFVRVRGAERPSAAAVHPQAISTDLTPPSGLRQGPWGLRPPASPQRSPERFAYDPRSLLEEGATRERPSG